MERNIVITGPGQVELLTPEQERERFSVTCAGVLDYWAENYGPGSLGHQWVIDDLNDGRGPEYFGARMTISDPENWAEAVLAFRDRHSEMP